MQKAAQEDAPFIQRRSGISIEKLRRSSLSHAGNFNYIKIKKNEFPSGPPALAGASMGGQDPVPPTGSLCCATNSPDICFNYNKSPQRSLWSCSLGLVPPGLRDSEHYGCGKQRCDLVTETCAWCLGCMGRDEASNEHQAVGYQQWVQFPFFGGKK